MKSKILFLLVGCSITMSAIAQSNTIGPGVAMKFNGSTGNYVDLGNAYNTLAFPFTVEAWVYISGAPTSIGGIFGSDNDVANYHGFWFRINHGLFVDFEFGDGVGSGSTDRRGFVTTQTVPLNKWVHLCGVANSVTDVSIYYNGKLVNKANSGGTATVTSLLHSAAGASIGWTENIHEESPFKGSIDDVRLWNVARTEAEIRSTMCKKLTGAETGLIGYWVADESYVSATLEDMSPSGIDGNIVGTMDKLTSGAPIGDESVYLYSADYTGLSLNLASAGGDKLKVSKIQNLPNGVHLYRVDSGPYTDVNLSEYPGYYYGVFTADGATTAKYTVTYNYSFSNGVVNALNETESTLWKRPDATAPHWGSMTATLTPETDRLTKNNMGGRAEYIFNIIENVNGKGEMNSVLPMGISLFPNPVTETLTISNLSNRDIVRVTDIAGNIVHEALCENGGNINIDVSHLYSGIYMITVSSAETTSSAKFVVVH